MPACCGLWPEIETAWEGPAQPCSQFAVHVNYSATRCITEESKWKRETVDGKQIKSIVYTMHE